MSAEDSAPFALNHSTGRIERPVEGAQLRLARRRGVTIRSEAVGRTAAIEVVEFIEVGSRGRRVSIAASPMRLHVRRER